MLETNAQSFFIYTDGGSRGNPGAAAIGVWVVTQDPQLENKSLAGSDPVEPAYSLAATIGTATNNEAEYRAFLASLTWLESYCQEHSVASVVWRLDSQLVVEQLKRSWKIKEPRLLVFAQDAWKRLQKFTFPYRFEAVRREFNRQADALVNRALDQAK